jgi:hypothetical protein
MSNYRPKHVSDPTVTIFRYSHGHLRYGNLYSASTHNLQCLWSFSHDTELDGKIRPQLPRIAAMRATCMLEEKQGGRSVAECRQASIYSARATSNSRYTHEKIDVVFSKVQAL